VDVPTRPETVYKALRAAVRSEGYPVERLGALPFLDTAKGWESPSECLVRADLRPVFLDAVTVLGDSPGDSWRLLGVQSEPLPSHWRRLFEWVDANYGTVRHVPRRIVDALNGAYRLLGSPPDVVATSVRFLVGDDGRLHSLAEATAHKFVIDDHPVLGAALREVGAEVSFALTHRPASTSFYVAAGVLPLTEVARVFPTEFGECVDPGPSVRPAVVLERLRTATFASALWALATSLCGTEVIPSARVLEDRLARVSRIDFVVSIRRRWSVAGTTVSVAADYEVEQERLVVVRSPTRASFLRSIGTAVAVLAFPEEGERRLADAVFFLLACRTPAEMQDELGRRRITWRNDDAESPPNDDDEGNSEGLVEVLADSLDRAVASGTRAHGGRALDSEPAAPPRVPIQRAPLPNLAAVQLSEVTSRRPVRPGTGAGGGGAWSRAWTPRTPEETELNLQLGNHAEQIVLKLERERVQRLGRSPDEVVWTAESDPYADHDILSLDDDGEQLWVEVKATIGTDGRFVWPLAEFSVAARERSRYVLYRVYKANTENPKFEAVA
jgi:hypothetical protein